MYRVAFSLLLAGCLSAAVAQEAEPIFRVTVTSRSIAAVNFHHRQGTTNVDLRGTAIMPRAEGKVRVESNTGATKMHVEAEKLLQPSSFGPEFPDVCHLGDHA